MKPDLVHINPGINPHVNKLMEGIEYAFARYFETRGKCTFIKWETRPPLKPNQYMDLICDKALLADKLQIGAALWQGFGKFREFTDTELTYFALWYFFTKIGRYKKADVAVLYDPFIYNLNYVKWSGILPYKNLDFYLLWSLLYMAGVGFDIITTRELEKLQDYKLIIVSNYFRLTREVAKYLRDLSENRLILLQGKNMDEFGYKTTETILGTKILGEKKITKYSWTYTQDAGVLAGKPGDVATDLVIYYIPILENPGIVYGVVDSKNIPIVGRIGNVIYWFGRMGVQLVDKDVPAHVRNNTIRFLTWICKLLDIPLDHSIEITNKYRYQVSHYDVKPEEGKVAKSYTVIEDGNPEIYVNGKNFLFLGLRTVSDPYKDEDSFNKVLEYIDKAATIGYTFVDVSVNWVRMDKTWRGYKVKRPPTPSDVKKLLDFSILDEIFNYALKKKVWLTIFFWHNIPPIWWFQFNPLWNHFVQTSHKGKMVPMMSFNSPALPFEVAAIKAVIEHYKNHPAYLGFHLQFGYTNENNYPGEPVEKGHHFDYSAHAIARWFQWQALNMIFPPMPPPLPVESTERYEDFVEWENKPGDPRKAWYYWCKFRMHEKKVHRERLIRAAKEADRDHVLIMSAYMEPAVVFSNSLINDFDEFL